MPKFSDEVKFASALRELQMRRSVYPKWVARGKMSQAVADHEIAVMEAICEDYRPADLFDEKPTDEARGPI